MIEAKVIDCQKKRYTNRETGETKEYYTIGCQVDGVGIGFVYSDIPFSYGEDVLLTLFTDRNHKFTVSLDTVQAV